MLVVAAQAAKRPNVIIIYTDDHGYTDLGLFGIDSNTETPNMDTLARGGALTTKITQILRRAQALFRGPVRRGQTWPASLCRRLRSV